MKLWVAGRRGALPQQEWEVLGVYSTKEKATARCLIADRDWVGPINLDEDTPEATIPWPDGQYPLWPPKEVL